MKPIVESQFEPKTISILSVAQHCGVQIMRVGHNHIAKCPFHGIDNTPSFVFYPSTNSWTCFGKCEGKNGRHNGGGVVQFVEQFYHVGYSEANKWLRQNFNYFEPVIIEPPKVEPPKIVPHPWVIYWHSMLNEHREYFHGRGFTDDFINREMWGWTGKRYALPVWEGEPGNSNVLGVRQRKSETQSDGFKYIGLKDMNPPTVWGRWYCRNQKTILAFAGEFDAALANQDGFPAFSVVNGIEAMVDFPKDWPELWFPDSKNMVAVFDRKEESYGGRLCQAWNKTKGSMMGKVFHWGLGEFKDYSEFRQTHSKEDFQLLMLKQGFNL